MSDTESPKISIAPQVYEKLKERLSASGASSVEELAGRILRDWVSASGETLRTRNRVSRADETVIEERLRALGYV